MSVTNSFHSSAKKHAIGSAAKLNSCELHNGRGYHSYFYDENKIFDIIGTAKTLSADTENFINSTFAGAIEEYNKSQKRQDRIIKSSAFEHFCENKKLDIANEFILQLGAKEFWDKYRIDTVIQTRKGEKIIKDYPGEIKKVMNDIFKKQAEAYEQIYETHGDIILENIKKAKAEAEKIMSDFSDEELKTFSDISDKKTKERKPFIEALPDPDRYFEYTEATETLATIKKLKLEDRTERGQMHIKIINEVGHYDEFSPHAHGISVCWADGYDNSLGSRVAKSVVLNKWALGVVQDRLHEIAFEEMQKHPEIFAGELLEDKQIGRNFDYTAEQIMRRKQKELKSEIDTIAKQGQEYIEQHRKESRELEKEIDQLQDTKFVFLNELNSIMENSAETLNELVEQTVDSALENSNGAYDNALYYLAACSDDEFDDISEKGYNLKKQILRENFDVEPMQAGLDNLINKIEENKVQLSWKEKQEFWKEYKNMTGSFWEELPELQKSLKFEIGKEYDNRRAALRSFYDAQYLLRSTRNIFVMIYAAIKAFISLENKESAEAKIKALTDERQIIINSTASFKKYSNYFREELKAGRRPCEKYLDEMTNILIFIDEKQSERSEPAKQMKTDFPTDPGNW